MIILASKSPRRKQLLSMMGLEFTVQTADAAYIEPKEPMDKAGAYGIQGYGSMFVSHLDGDYFCVMGLPVCTLAWMLRDAGVRILGQA